MIPGYTIKESLKKDHDWQLLRGVRAEDDLPVLIKAANAQSPESGLTEQLRAEFSTLQGLDVPGVLRVHALLRESRNSALVLEDPGGTLLNVVLDAGKFEIADFLAVSIQMATVVSELHRHGIVHTQLRPDVFLLGDRGQGVWLSGLERAVKADASNGSKRELSAGNLAYMAPEQTGRVDAGIDQRTDLYLLGLTFYEMLTGHPPFRTDDPLELIHCQLARIPKSPGELDSRIPRPLSDIVMRLLMKRAGERYMSAAGVLADINECAAQYERTGNIESLAIAQHDRQDSFVIPEKLYGRDDEKRRLLEAFDSVRTDGTRLVMVAGYSGVGKTSLIRDLRDPVAEQGGYFVSGKYDQLERSNPYSAILHAFRELVRKILTEPDSEIESWRQRIMTALGANAQVVIEVIPELELIVGTQPPLPELKPVEAQNRFNFFFHKFIAALGRPERPLVMFLDDLQWASAASIRLFESWVTGLNITGLLIIGAYRDNEVDATHPLMSVVRDLRESHDAFEEIQLSPLGAGSIDLIVRDALRSDADETKTLSSCVHEKTDGNPFFARSFLRSLFEEGQLSQGADARWTWDVESINELRAAENVVDLMVRKIERLPSQTRNVLKVAACIGGRIEPVTLATAYGRGIGESMQDLEPAISNGLIERYDGGFLAFYHDRVQEAAYGLIPVSERAPLHHQIGSLLLHDAEEAQLDDALFEVVNHLNLGSALIRDGDEATSLARLNLRAGLKAKLSTAYGSANSYFSSGIELLGPDPWSDHYSLAFELHRQNAECAYLCGKFDEAEEGFDLLMEKARSNRELGVVYNLRIIQYENLSRFAEAAALGREAVALFGIRFPDSEEEKLAGVDREIESIQGMLEGKAVSDLVNLPRMQDEDVKTCMKLLMTIWAPNYISGDLPMTMLIAAYMVRLSLQNGNTEESAYGYVTHAITIAARTNDYELSYEFGQLAMSVNRELDDRTARAKVNHMFSCYIGLWREHIDECFRYSRAGYEAGIETGDFTYGGYSGFHESWHALFRGVRLDRYIDEYSVKLQFLSGYKYQSIGDAHQLMLQWGRCLQGDTKAPASLDGNGFSEAHYVREYGETPFFIAFYYVAKLNIAYLHHDLTGALRYAELAEKVIFGVRGMIWDALLCFNHALALAAAFDSLDDDAKHHAMEKLEHLKDKMRLWSENSSENFRHQYGLVKAEISRLKGQFGEAQKEYEQSIENARENGFVNMEALACELAGRSFLQRGRPGIALAYLRDAAGHYRHWGANGVVKQMELTYEGLAGELEAQAGSTWNRPPESLDVAAILKASQAISGEMIEGELVARLMRIVLEDAGAERALLLCPGDSDWTVDAVGEVGDDGISLHVDVDEDAVHDWSDGVVNYVSRTATFLLSRDAQQDERLTGDRYVQHQGTRSVLCVPILHQQEITAILYLENNLMPNAFTSERALVVQALAAQAAIALKNARLYSDVVKEIEERRQAESALRVIASGTAADTGEDFFQSLVKCLADSLKVKCVFVAECIRPQNRRVRTLVLMKEGEISDNIEYELSGTPCESVINGQTCYFPENLEQLFPVEKGFQSYLGAPAMDLSGRVLGHLAILDSSDMSHLPHAESILRIFATRVGVELHRKRMQDELRASEEKYRLLVDNQTDLVVKLDRDGRLLFASPSYCEMFSCGEESLQDRTFDERILAGDRERVGKEWRKLFDDPWTAEFEHRATTAEGERWLGWALKAVLDESGDVVEIVGVGRDVTKRRYAEEEARRNLHTLAHAGRLQSMGEMASTMAHELNQPLTAILSFSQASQRVIQNTDYDRNELEFALERIAVNANRAGDIISHMRGYIRKGDQHTEASDINRLIRDVMDLVRSELLQIEIDAVLDLQETVPAVLVDPIQIQQVILNLVRNSIEAIERHTAEARRITIETRASRQGQVEVMVSDTGPGLDDHIAEKAFDAFITTKPDGMGIGLSICKSIIESHGGELLAGQRPGGGARFSFTLQAGGE
ncbi:MAG: AAA family ATPase [Gammaproteobacteria bacterium]|nr:AAA family ATPase [Gammaproteobacteria bacterium]